MTGAQATHLKALTIEAHKPKMFDDSHTKAEASKRIDELKETAGV